MSTEIRYRYAERSSYVDGEGLRLETTAPSRVAGTSASPVFFSGFVEHPAAVAAALLLPQIAARVVRKVADSPGLRFGGGSDRVPSSSGPVSRAG